jgi:hypothetical protein
MTTFEGSWDVINDALVGKMVVVFDITEQDGAIHGTARSDAETADFLDVVAEGSRLTWTLMVTTPMRVTLKFDVNVDGDTMTGTSRAGPFLASTLNGSRLSER